MELNAGTKLGHYEIVGTLGSGGMGEVYEARDVRLGRNVALKILPSEYSTHEDRLRRFMQEARTASALNHPNIVSIYDIGDSEIDGQRVHYIAMELVDGVTLRAKIHAERTRLKTLLRYLAQAADGLARAQAAGIIHRDLKPDNIMITREGQAKVLDFGLAKLTEETEAAQSADAPTHVREETREGIVMGSVGYMSPEQIEGRAVDARTDVFSFGCILYEAITHRKPFEGKSNLDSLHAVLHSEPVSITELNPDAPVELRRILKRCLAKEPDSRYQSFKDLAAQLHDLVDEYDSLTPGSGSGAVSPLLRKRARFAIPLSAALLILITAAAVFGWRRYSAREELPRFGSIERITTSGNLRNASISPDGKYVALVLGERGMYRVLVRQLATGSEVEVRPLSADGAGPPRFTGDGNYMFITRWPEDGSYSAYLEKVPTLGGTAKRLLENLNSSISLAPDEKSFVFRRLLPDSDEHQLVLADVDGGNQRIIATLRSPQRGDTPHFSPDGSTIAWPVRSTEGGLHGDVLLLNADGSNQRNLLKQRFFWVANVMWDPSGKGLWMTGNATEGNSQLWHVAYPDGSLQRITNDTNSYLGPLISRDGNTILMVQGESRARLWRVLPDGTSESLTPENERNVPVNFSVTPEGDVVFDSGAGGPPDIWKLSLKSGGSQRLTDQSGAEYSPVVGRSGSLYYLSEQNGPSEFWTADSTGSRRRRIAVAGRDAWLAISPDEKWLVYPAGTALERMGVADGRAERLFQGNFGAAAFSPDGKFLVSTLRGTAGTARLTSVVILPASGGRILTRIPLSASSSGGYLAPEFGPDGKTLVYSLNAKGTDNLWSHPIDGGTPRQISKFDSGIIYDFSFAADGKSILVSRATETSDAVLLRKEKKAD